MHPSLQHTFLEVLKTYHRLKGHQFFLTTHSNHLLDLLEDNELASIFSFSQIESGSLLDAALKSTPPAPRFRIRAFTLRDRQTLVELGVRPSATFLANATIWVEGISDCSYLRAYMEAFVQYLQTRGDEDLKRLTTRLGQYKEDRHYTFVEYSGSNPAHFGPRPFAWCKSLGPNALIRE
jgi:predicted ATP-dependent endonuclease of OLD family